MKKLLAILLLCLLLGCMLLPAAAQEDAPLPPAVRALIADTHPRHTITAFSGYGDDTVGQWALALTLDGQHVLVIAEKARGQAAYAITLENPAAFPPGDSQPGVLIDTGGDVVFVSFRDAEHLWSYRAGKSDGTWGEVEVTVYPNQPALAEHTEWGMRVQDGLLMSEALETDENDNIIARGEWPPIPVPHIRGKTHLATYDWQLFPAYPPQLVMPDGEPRAEVLDALTPPGWTRTAADINAGGIYVQGTDEQGHIRLLLKAWVGDNTGEYYVDSITQPLPQGTWINPQPLGMEVAIYPYMDKEDIRFYCIFRRDRYGVWGLRYIEGSATMRIGPHYVKDDREPPGPYCFGNHPWNDIREVDITALPGTFDKALQQLDQSNWAMVNNPNPKDRLHLRKTPDRSAPTWGKFYNGTPLRVLQHWGEWVQVKIPTGLSIGAPVGWMMSKYLAFGADMNHVQPAFPELTHVDSVDNEALPVYEEPDILSFWRALSGYQYWIMGIAGTDWYYVYFPEDGIGGYMKQEWFWEGNG